MRKLLLTYGMLACALVCNSFGQTIPGDKEISGDSWVPVGPAPVVDFIPGQNVSGRATALAVNPFQAQEVWLGTAGGGVWHSRDGGGTWQPVPVSGTDPTAGSLAIGAIAVEGCDADGCDRIWVGTGENSLRRDTQHGTGLLLGVPGEFRQVSLVHVGRSRLERGSINKIVLGPPGSDGLSDYVLVSVSRGVTSNATHATVNAPEPRGGYGIHRFDFGSDGDANPATGTWTHFNVPGTGSPLPREALANRVSTDLVIDARDSQKLYAAFIGTGIFFSDDGGTSWCPLNAGVTGADASCPSPSVIPGETLPDFSATIYDYIRIAQAPTNPDILYALLGKCEERFVWPCFSGRGYELYKREAGSGPDPRRGWKQVELGGIGNLHSRYTNVLEIDPRDADIVYLGFISSLWRIETGDPATPNAIAVSNRAVIHDDHHALVFAENSGGGYVVYAASDGGAFRFALGATPEPSEREIWTWVELNDNLPTIQFQSIAGHHDTPVIIGGTQDNGCLEFTGGRGWNPVGIQDCGFTIIDADDRATYFTTDYQYAPQRRRGMDWEYILGNPSCGKIEVVSPSEQTIAFYPPFVQDRVTNTLYFASKRLYSSTDGGECWEPVSPEFDPSPRLFSDTGRQNVITAVGLEPGPGGNIFVGLYDGSIWFSDRPCDDGGDGTCWTHIAAPGRAGHPPQAPVNALAVPPRDGRIVYAAYSGFNINNHVWRHDGRAWEPRSAGLGDIPANSLAFEARPSASADVLWLGTDAGVFRSRNEGIGWERVNRGMPDVPVYDLIVDQHRGRVFAATHGRGVYLLAEPFLMTYEGWVNGDIWDIPVYGHSFPVSGDHCTMEILLEDGTSCTSGTRDVIEGPRRDGEIRVAEDGQLTSGSSRTYGERDVVWACFNGSCLGDPENVPIETCNRTRPDGTPNRISAIRVRCDSGTMASTPVGDSCPRLANPPSTAFELGTSMSSGGGTGSGGEAEPSSEDESFVLMAVVQSGDGATRTLCEAEVDLPPGRTDAAILQAAQDALNTSADCAAATVEATVQGLGDPSASTGEDDFGSRPQLVLAAPGVIGGQLVTAFAAPPGRATGQCFRVNGLGVPSLGQVLISKVHFATSPGGAQGGTVRLTENSNLGRCTVTIPTRPGDEPSDIAARVEAAFLSDTTGSAACPASSNPRDVAQHGDMLITVVARTLEICTDDPGVGFAIAPEELHVPQLTIEAPTPIPIGRHQLSIFGGLLLTDEDHPLKSAPEVGFRYGYAALPHFTVESELSFAASKFEGDEAILARVQGQGVIDLVGSKASLRPFILGGVGIARVDAGRRSDNAMFKLLGSGIRFAWRRDVGFRLDGRYIWLDEFLGSDQSHNIEVAMGVSFRF